MKVSRRNLLQSAMVSAVAVPLSRVILADSTAKRSSALPCIVSTWSFGKQANEKALQVMHQGRSLLDAVEQGIRLTERDETNSSVGVGGVPNAEGIVQLDACIMLGPGHRAGSVAALENFAHPISVARRVMEKTRHVMLVGEGAARFARKEGFQEAQLLTDVQRKAWQEWKQARASEAQPATAGHDTIALIAVDTNHHVAGGCSTSGLGYKLPGRVGDSPILGSGLYVDNEVGAAGATGVGENVMRFCGSFMIVEGMRHGLTPGDACVSAIRRIQRLDGRDFADLHINFIALDRHGRFGAAGTDEGFQFAVASENSSEVIQAEIVAT